MKFIKNLKYRFKNQDLLEQALTHPSLGKNNYQRLEFLGDSVIEYHISQYLFDKFPHFDEGSLTNLRARLVCQKTLSQIARDNGLHLLIRLNKAQEIQDGNKNPAILADSLEAIIGAICVEAGIQKSGEIFMNLLLKANVDLSEKKDSKSLLQEILQKEGKNAPTYETIEEKGPAHNLTFLVQVSAENVVLARGRGKSKRKAEQIAASKAIENMDEIILKNRGK